MTGDLRCCCLSSRVPLLMTSLSPLLGKIMSRSAVPSIYSSIQRIIHLQILTSLYCQRPQESFSICGHFTVEVITGHVAFSCEENSWLLLPVAYWSWRKISDQEAGAGSRYDGTNKYGCRSGSGLISGVLHSPINRWGRNSAGSFPLWTTTLFCRRGHWEEFR